MDITDTPIILDTVPLHPYPLLEKPVSADTPVVLPHLFPEAPKDLAANKNTIFGIQFNLQTKRIERQNTKKANKCCEQDLVV